MKEISFPVFKIGKDTPIIESGVSLFLSQTKDRDTNEIFTKIEILDDKNIEGSTLGLRRLKLRNEGIRLKNLGMAIYFVGDLIKLATKSTWFIDNDGKIFNYKKAKRVPLIFRRIVFQTNIATGGTILEVQGIPGRFKTLYNLRLEDKYAGILKDKHKYILYGIYTELYADTWRLI